MIGLITYVVSMCIPYTRGCADAHEFIRFAPIPDEWWPHGTFGGTRKVDGGMRRVLVPLVRRDARSGGGEAGGGEGSRCSGQDCAGVWRLDTRAGVHHRSDRVVNGPRKGNEAYGARFREHELVRCVPQ